MSSPKQVTTNAPQSLPEHLHNRRIGQPKKQKWVIIHSHMLTVHKISRIG